MFGYRYYQDLFFRQIAVVLAKDERGNDAFWAEVIEGGEVVKTYEGMQFNLDSLAVEMGWAFIKEVRTT